MRISGQLNSHLAINMNSGRRMTKARTNSIRAPPDNMKKLHAIADSPAYMGRKSQPGPGRESFSFKPRYFLRNQEDREEEETQTPAVAVKNYCPSSDSGASSEDQARHIAALLKKCKPKPGHGGEKGIDAAKDSSGYRQPPDFESLYTYEEYLDYYVTDKDMYFFESDEMARFVISLKYSIPELLTKKEFDAIMKEIETAKLEKTATIINIAREIEPEQIKSPLMRVLADREASNRSRTLACIIYVRTVNPKGEEVSAWIDFQVRLKKEGNSWYEYYAGRRKLVPSITDLCYYNWSSFQSRFNSSDNYLVTTNIQAGLQFMNKDDRKVVTINPKANPGENTQLLHVADPGYLGCMVYDHSLRIKA